MNLIEKMRLKFAELDANNAYAAAVGLLGSLLSEGGVSMVYAFVAVVAQGFTVYASIKRQKRELRKSDLENELLELDVKIKQKTLENE